MDTEIIIIGAGAAGLMAARELGRAGRRVIVLEARDRIGGRIFPLPAEKFGYAAEGGAEFVHGPAKVTKALLKEAGLTYEAMPTDGEFWNMVNGQWSKEGHDPTQESDYDKYEKELHAKLQQLKTDQPIAEFLRENFSDEKYGDLRDWISRMVQGFDAADPEQISAFSLRDEWLGQDEWEQGRVKEGYEPVIEFLLSACARAQVQILLNQRVTEVQLKNDRVEVLAGGKVYQAEKVIVTVPLPVISQIKFDPVQPEKLRAAANIGFGQVVKLILNFQDQFWAQALNTDLSKMSFLFTDQPVGTWWTQYPHDRAVLTGWVAGPRALKFKDKSEAEILQIALESLAKIFHLPSAELAQKLTASKIVNWPADPLALGAYSYSKVGSEAAYKELRQSVNDQLYFAGEAVYLEAETATVEGALGSGQAVAAEILKKY